MQSINHGKYINYLILQPNSGIDVLQEGKGNSLFPEGFRQGMIKKTAPPNPCSTPMRWFDTNLYSFANNLLTFSTSGPFLSVLRPVIELRPLSAQILMAGLGLGAPPSPALIPLPQQFCL